MENLFDALCFVVQYPPNRKKFLEDEGLHLMNLMIRYINWSRQPVYKKQASRQVFSSKSRQVIRQDFLRDGFMTGKQNRVLRREAGPETSF